MRSLSDKCGYCGCSIKYSDRSWRRTPQGRPYCPECGAIPKDWQRDSDGVVADA